MEQFGIRFNTINPSQLSASSLASLIKKYECAIVSEFSTNEKNQDCADKIIVALTSIEDNCTLLKFFIPYVLGSYAMFVSSIPHANYSTYGSATKSSRDFIHEVLKVNATFNTSAELVKISDGKTEIVSSLSYDDISILEQCKVVASSTKYGKITTVGGKQQPKVKVLLDNGQSISCTLKDNQLVFAAAKLLYSTVSIKGIASYIRFDGVSKLVDFEIHTINEFIPLKPIDLIKKVAPLVKEQLDRIQDFDDYFSQLRED